MLKIKNIVDRYKDFSKMSESGISRLLKTEESDVKDKGDILELIPIYHKKSETVGELNEYEEQSLAMLLHAIKLQAE